VESYSVLLASHFFESFFSSLFSSLNFIHPKIEESPWGEIGRKLASSP